MTGRPLRIGIVGARGIGKHHAKWFARCGCEVTAIFGTTPESAAAAGAVLRESFGFSGRVFHDWDRFRTEGGFEVCSICSPAEQHWANARDLAADGRHLLCEKPLVWNWDYSPEQMKAEAGALVETAVRHGVILAVNAQYPAALAGWAELYRAVMNREPRFEKLWFILETRGRARSAHGPAEAWVDLAPHPIAVLDAIAPGAVDWSTLRHSDGPHEAVIDFDWTAAEQRIQAHIECRRTSEGELRRQIGNQDLIADFDGCTQEGDFMARLRSGDRQWIGKDFMRVSVERFVDAVRSGDGSRVLVDGPAGLRQQEALTGVWARCWRANTT